MRRGKAIVTILLLAVWAGCTAHCAIESLASAAELACCNEDGGQSDQAPYCPRQCVCSAFQAGGYVSQDSALSIPLPLDGVCLFAVAPQQGELVTRPGSVELTHSPPGPSEPWPFFLRSALLARAPSLAS